MWKAAAAAAAAAAADDDDDVFNDRVLPILILLNIYKIPIIFAGRYENSCVTICGVYTVTVV